MAQSTPSSKRRRILVHCSTATGPTQTVELGSAEPIVSTPSSNAVKRGIQHLYDGLPSEQLTYLRVDRKQGEPWEAMVSSDPMLARVKSRHTRVAHESEQRRMTTLERELEWLKKKDKERDAEMKARDAEFKALAALHMDRIEALEVSNIGHETSISFLLEQQRDLSLYGAVTVIARKLTPEGLTAHDNLQTFTDRIKGAVRPKAKSAALKHAIAARPVVQSLFTPSNADKLLGAINIQARHEAAHPNMRMAEMISTLFRFEAAEYAQATAKGQDEGVVALALRWLLAICPLDEVRGWMAEISQIDETRRPTEDQLRRFSKVL